MLFEGEPSPILRRPESRLREQAVNVLTNSLKYYFISLESDSVEGAGIITPEMAVGFTWFNRFTNDTNGYLVVCDEPNYTGYNGCKNWRRADSVVPAGRKYAGFRVLSDVYREKHLLQIYWK